MSKMREAMDRRGLSFRDITTLTGYNAGYLSRVSNGLRHPSPVVALTIAKTLGLKLNDILDAGDTEAETT